MDPSINNPGRRLPGSLYAPRGQMGRPPLPLPLQLDLIAQAEMDQAARTRPVGLGGQERVRHDAAYRGLLQLAVNTLETRKREAAQAAALFSQQVLLPPPNPPNSLDKFLDRAARDLPRPPLSEANRIVDKAAYIHCWKQYIAIFRLAYHDYKYQALFAGCPTFMRLPDRRAYARQLHVYRKTFAAALVDPFLRYQFPGHPYFEQLQRQSPTEQIVANERMAHRLNTGVPLPNVNPPFARAPAGPGMRQEVGRQDRTRLPSMAPIAQGNQHQGNQHQGYQHQGYQHQGYQHQGNQHPGTQHQGNQYAQVGPHVQPPGGLQPSQQNLAARHLLPLAYQRMQADSPKLRDRR